MSYAKARSLSRSISCKSVSTTFDGITTVIHFCFYNIQKKYSQKVF
ncbi:hypothetical protein DPEC_G00379900 [Dallia pectoralis]|nr:hypothetical protein DPEC_G00379900 [Dallia pectoralis]